LVVKSLNSFKIFKMNNSLAPVILFVYNRPWHTRQALEALKQNDLAKDSRLYVFSDGPKENVNREDLGKILEVRSLIREEKWCGEVNFIERDENLGLAQSVIRGVSKIISKHGKVIVLEDDIVVGKYFLNFLNKGLEIYESEQRVFGISGYQFSPVKPIKENSYFLPIMSSLGYGTWLDRWNKISFDDNELLQIINSRNLAPKLDFGNLSYYQMLKDQVYGKIDSWAIRFYVSMFLNNGVFLFPKSSLLQNIGFDGTGVHSGYAIPNHYRHDINLNKKIEVERREVDINRFILESSKKGTFDFLGRNETGIKKILKKIIPPALLQFARRKIIKKKKSDSQKITIPRYTYTTVKLIDKEIGVPDIASYNFMHKEIFSQEIYKFYTGNKEPYIIDCGANIGLSIIYLKSLYPDSKIVAFEPDPEIFQILKGNVEAFNFDQIELIQKGLWNIDTSLFFKSEGADAGQIGEIDKNNPTPEKRIEVVSLKPYLQKPVDFLKLDIEGSETIVLKDIKNDLKNVKNIFVEYHSFVNQKQTLNEIIEILTNANFRLHISSPGLTSRNPFIHLNTYNNMDMQLNIYGIKRDVG